MYYDAAGRLIRTELPDSSFSRVEFSPWHVTSYDPNDTVLEPGNAWYAARMDAGAKEEDRRAAELAAEHADTPAQVFLDSLGREVISVAHNRVKDEAGALRDEKYVTFTKLDAEGKPLWIRDARGNLVMQYIIQQKPTRWEDEPNENIPTGSVPCYDIAGNLLFQHSMDGGDRWMINDAAGQPFYAWDVNEGTPDDGDLVLEQRIFHTTYDELRRPLKQRLQIESGGWRVVERFNYGETHLEAKARNLRGQIYQHYDPSGLMTNQSFDFKGNLLEVQRRLASDYKASVIHWPEEPPDEDFEDETFTQITEYDALSRMTRLYNWHRTAEHVAVYEPRYNRRGVLDGEELMVGADTTRPDRVLDLPYTAPERVAAIAGIEYNAKGQRTRIEHGNGSVTTYEYDDNTFRLINLRTQRTNTPASCGAGQSSTFVNDTIVQDLHYWYDPVGNITEIHDNAHKVIFHDNQEIKPHNRYQYDALYRLIRTDGRENGAASGAPTELGNNHADHPFPCVPPNAFRNYTQHYRYDDVGNILGMQHQAGSRGGWTRAYEYAEDSNHLLKTSQGNGTVNEVAYDYDTHGSMLNLNRTPNEYRLRWDYRDMIHQVNLGGGGQAWYNYDAGKQRTRKTIVDRNGNVVEERLYLGGMEYYRRWVNGNPVEEIETHHLFVDDQRVLIVEDVLETDNTNLPTGVLFRYQYSNHLGSVGLELDGKGAVITYEEYHPYGTTAYQAVGKEVKAVAKRYRYTGMERDEETGLSYHTARYYLPWLGRWGGVDPILLLGGNNFYRFSINHPVSFSDSSGKQPQEAGAAPVFSPSPTPSGPGVSGVRPVVSARVAEEALRRIPRSRVPRLPIVIAGAVVLGGVTYGTTQLNGRLFRTFTSHQGSLFHTAADVRSELTSGGENPIRDGETIIKDGLVHRWDSRYRRWVQGPFVYDDSTDQQSPSNGASGGEPPREEEAPTMEQTGAVQLSSESSTQPPNYRSGHTTLNEFDMDRMAAFNTRHRTRDKLAGHEMLQNAWLRRHYGVQRGSGEIVNNNPAIALGEKMHTRVGREQRRLGLWGNRLDNMTAEQNITLNDLAMRRAGVPHDIRSVLRREATRYAANIGP